MKCSVNSELNYVKFKVKPLKYLKSKDKTIEEMIERAHIAQLKNIFSMGF